MVTSIVCLTGSETYLRCFCSTLHTKQFVPLFLNLQIDNFSRKNSTVRFDEICEKAGEKI